MNSIATILRESRLARFLIPAGVILIVFGLVVLVINTGNRDYVRTEATVTKVELEQEAHTDSSGNRENATYTVGVKYTADGREYEQELYGMSEYKPGDRVTIYYDPADPSRITMTVSLIMPIILIAAGAAAFAGGIVSAVNSVKKYKRMKEQEREWANG